MTLRSSAALLLITLGGCGQLGFEALDVGTDFDGGPGFDGGAPQDGGPPVDAGPLSFDQLLLVTNTNEVTFEGSCTGSAPVELSGADEASVPCESGRFQLSVSRSTDGSSVVEATQSAVRASAEWLRDTVVPQVDSFRVPATSTTRIVPTEVDASDNDQVAAFCLDWRGVDPETTSSCFVPVETLDVAAASSLSLSPLPFPIGFVAGDYNLRVFVRDRAGNVSSPQRASVSYAPTPPPLVSRVVATAGPTHAEPPTLSEVQVSESAQVYVRWNVESDVELAATEIYTTVNERDMARATMDGDCPVTAERNACAIIRAPRADYFRVRVVARDVLEQVSSAMSPPLNVPFRFLGGATEASTGSGAVTANFQPFDPGTGSTTVGAGTMVVTDDGTLYFREASGDVISISPTTALVERVLRVTGTSTGDGGGVTDATATWVHRIDADGRGGLFVWDEDRVRRIDLTSDERRIETVLGGGALSEDGTPPLAFQIQPPDRAIAGRVAFSVSTNGDIFFTADGYETTSALHHYDRSAGSVRAIRIQGAWRDGLRYESCAQSSYMIEYDDDGEATEAVAVVRTQVDSTCEASDTSDGGWADFVRFDPRTGDALGVAPDNAVDSAYFGRTGAHPITGLDGTNLFISEGERLGRYDPTAQTVEAFAGTGRLGECPDGTEALSCAMRLFDATIARDGSVYVLDNGQIRTFDEDGRVVTLYGRTFGNISDRADALDHRFFDIEHLQRDGALTTLVDVGASYMLEFQDGQPVRRLAGTGISGEPDFSMDADAEPIWTVGSGQFWGTFHRIGNDVYSSTRYNVVRLEDNRWVNAVGGGSTPYYSLGAGVDGDDVLFPSSPSSYPQAVLADNGSALLISVYAYNSTAQRQEHARIIQYNTLTGLVTPLAGDSAVRNDFCADDTPISTCTVPNSGRLKSGSWSPSRNAWLLHARGSERVVIMDGVTPITTLGVFPEPVTAVAHDGFTDATLVACTEAGELLGMDQTSGAITPIDLRSPTIRCAGPVDINEGTLSFVFVQNGLQGIAEMPLP
ncbi:MAG: hypothetical protein AB8H86_25295 [Polyangiales bacterium]